MENVCTYAILSDIHANLQALRAVVDDMRRYENLISDAGFSGVFLLGDLIDYGMQSNEVIAYIRDEFEWKLCSNIWGNHERAIMTEDFDGFSSQRGVRSAKYTAKMLTDETRDYIDNNMNHDGFEKITLDDFDKVVLAIHGSEEDSFWRAISPDNVRGHYEGVDIVLSGHSHIPGAFMRFIDTDDEKMRNKRPQIFINPGSVGQPRNHNPRAQYAIWRPGTGEVELRAVEYDIKKAMSFFDGETDYFYRDRLEMGI